MSLPLLRAREGDPRAVDRVTQALRPRLTRMAAYYARRTGEDPDDLLQEACYGLLEALRELDLSIGSPEQYLLKRARWRMLDSVRRAHSTLPAAGGGDGSPRRLPDGGGSVAGARLRLRRSAQRPSARHSRRASIRNDLA